MAFVMIATGATSRAPVRSVPVRVLVLAAASAALALLAGGGALGYWLASSSVQPAEIMVRASADRPASPVLPYTLEQLGALSARMFRLESEAAQLSKRFGLAKKDASSSGSGAAREKDLPVAMPNAARSKELPIALPADAHETEDEAGHPATGAAGARGGPLLAPRPSAIALPGSLSGLDAQLANIERQIALVADAAALRTLELMRLPSRLPIPGAGLTSTFGNRVDPFAGTHAFHAGLDFAAGVGTPIRSAAGGVVVFAGMRPDFGRVVEIDHGNGLKTRYAHASKLLVETGALVGPGEPIALVGSTGRSTGPHLHFEVLRQGAAVDPKRYLAGL